MRAVVERYLHGLKFNNVKDFEAAFWPEARLFFVKKDGSIGQLTQQEWYRMFAGAEGKEEEGTLTILAVDVTDNAASVKVIETRHMPRLCTSTTSTCYTSAANGAS